MTEQLVNIAGEAIRNVAPAQISFGEGEADFAINRRAAKLAQLNPGKQIIAPIDHSVPVLRVLRKDGSLLAILFGYACHNTTMTAEFNEVGGDYAGFAQQAIERAHPGATALFLMLCGGDQNPDPRSKREYAVKYGNDLAQSVDRVLGGKMQPVSGPIRPVYKEIDLPFAANSRDQFVTESTNPNVFRQRRARFMLERYDRGQPIQSVQYPVQAIRFDKLTVGGAWRGSGGRFRSAAETRVPENSPDRRGIFERGDELHPIRARPERRRLRGRRGDDLLRSSGQICRRCGRQNRYCRTRTCKVAG